MRADRDVVARLRERLDSARKEKEEADQHAVELESRLSDVRCKVEDLRARIAEYEELLDIGGGDELIPTKRRKASRAEQSRRVEAATILLRVPGCVVQADDLASGVSREIGAEVSARALNDLLKKHPKQFVQEGKGAWRLATAKHEERPRTDQVDPASGNEAGVTNQVDW